MRSGKKIKKDEGRIKAADAARFDVRGFRLRVGYGATGEV
jgi:hypothetical protein